MGRASSTSSSASSQHQEFVNSYQHTLTIQQLDEPPPSQKQSRLQYQFTTNPGNSFLQPNVGRTNRYDYDIFGLTLAELLERLRYALIGSTAWLLLVLTLTWWQRLLRPKALVSSILLALLDGGLLVAVATRPLDAGYSSGKQPPENNGSLRIPGVASNSQTAAVDRVIHIIQLVDDGGKCVLDHPLGKTSALIVCTLLCWTVHGPWELLVGLTFVMEALVLVYCWAFYPEFRRVYDVSSEGAASAAPLAATRSWSHYASSTAVGTQDETDSLLVRASDPGIAASSSLYSNLP